MRICILQIYLFAAAVTGEGHTSRGNLRFHARGASKEFQSLSLLKISASSSLAARYLHREYHETNTKGDNDWFKDAKEITTICPKACPYVRYIPWKDLSESQRALASGVLRYTEESWNRPSKNKVEKLKFDSLNLNEQQVVYELFSTTKNQREERENKFAVVSQVWDCHINHYYHDHWWIDLEKAGVQQHWETLGWTRSMWDYGIGGQPLSEYKYWYQLSSSERLAARQLCYFPQLWDRSPPDMTRWDFLPNPRNNQYPERPSTSSSSSTNSGDNESNTGKKNPEERDGCTEDFGESSNVQNKDNSGGESFALYDSFLDVSVIVVAILALTCACCGFVATAGCTDFRSWRKCVIPRSWFYYNSQEERDHRMVLELQEIERRQRRSEALREQLQERKEFLSQHLIPHEYKESIHNNHNDCCYNMRTGDVDFNGKSDSDEDEEDDVCPICQEPFAPPHNHDRQDDNNHAPFLLAKSTSGLCQHEFHYACISAWLLRKTDCPNCRNTFLAADLPSEATNARASAITAIATSEPTGSRTIAIESTESSAASAISIVSSSSSAHARDEPIQSSTNLEHDGVTDSLQQQIDVLNLIGQEVVRLPQSSTNGNRTDEQRQSQSQKQDEGGSVSNNTERETGTWSSTAHRTNFRLLPQQQATAMERD